MDGPVQECTTIRLVTLAHHLSAQDNVCKGKYILLKFVGRRDNSTVIFRVFVVSGPSTSPEFLKGASRRDETLLRACISHNHRQSSVFRHTSTTGTVVYCKQTQALCTTATFASDESLKMLSRGQRDNWICLYWIAFVYTAYLPRTPICKCLNSAAEQD